jgi:hypothetical protein
MLKIGGNRPIRASKGALREMSHRYSTCRLLILSLLSAGRLTAQYQTASLVTSDSAISSSSLRADNDAPALTGDVLPDEPGWVLPAPPQPLPPCAGQTNEPLSTPCIAINPYKKFLDTTTPVPLTPGQKAYLAFHNYRDPGNLLTITGTAAYTIGTNSHTAYGPGFRGFRRNVGYSLAQDGTGEFFGTFLIPAITHEDPHYHREPNRSIPHRFFHAISRTVIAQGDDGHNMPNYATLLTGPICSEISNLYVPGIAGNGPSTAKRIVTGYPTDPIGNVITEFLPDIAKHINIRVIFVQRLINMATANSLNNSMNMSADSPAAP